MGPISLKVTKVRDFLPIAFDNDAFSAYQNNTEWDLNGWLEMIETVKTKKLKPLWMLAPDTVGDAHDTLKKFFAYRYKIPKEIPVAFAVQDGMLPQDVPVTADVIFVGGTLEWKWKTLAMWCNAFPRVHVGRVNRPGKLIACARLGVESVDGTGWFRRPSSEWMDELTCFFEKQHEQQASLF